RSPSRGSIFTPSAVPWWEKDSGSGLQLVRPPASRFVAVPTPRASWCVASTTERRARRGIMTAHGGDSSSGPSAASAAGATSTGFHELGLDPRIEEALRVLGYEEPTPIQREAVPPQMAGRDLLAQAATGTGKT